MISLDILIIIILVVLLIIFFIVNILLGKGIGDLTCKLKKINSTETNSKLLLTVPFKKLSELTFEINRNIERKISTEAKYKKSNLEMKKAIANISHDLRTPLTSIIGYIQLIEDETLPYDERKEYIEIVRKRSLNLQSLISSFYDLSRLESKEQKFKLKPINLYDILCETAASFYNDFLNAGIEPVIKVDENTPSVIGDENAARRVFSNLILNAIRHGKGNFEISLKNEGKFVVMEFKNAAPELTKEDAAHLFDRFFMADRTRNGNNTGLGLTIAKELIEQMGHSIFAKLKDGKLTITIKWKL